MAQAGAFSPSSRTNALRQSLSQTCTIQLHRFSHGGKVPLYCTYESSTMFPKQSDEFDQIFSQSLSDEQLLIPHFDSSDSEDEHTNSTAPMSQPFAVHNGSKKVHKSDNKSLASIVMQAENLRPSSGTKKTRHITQQSFKHFRIQSVTIHGGFTLDHSKHNDALMNVIIGAMDPLDEELEEQDEQEEDSDMETATYKSSVIIHDTPKDKKVTFQEPEEDPTRGYILREIVATEETYYRGLAVLLTELIMPLFDNGLIDDKYYSQCISNLPELITFHDGFLTQLIDAYEQEDDQKDNDSFTSIAQVFTAQNKEEFVDMYMRYIRDYDVILNLFGNTFHKNTELQTFLKQKRKEKKPLTNYLISPVQRVPRYILLLTDLKKHTNVTDKDYKNIESALELVEEITNEINERQRKIENMSQCFQIQAALTNLTEPIVRADRTYQKQFVFVKKSNKHQRQFFCFSDIIIMTNHLWVVKEIMDIRIVDINVSKTLTSFTMSCNKTKEDSYHSYISKTKEDVAEFAKRVIKNRQVLIEAGKADTQDKLNRQLLNACRYGHVSEVEVLLSKGANAKHSDQDDPFGATCLSEAARRGEAEIVQLLIERGGPVNDKISQGFTALHLACERGHISVVRVLLKNGCEPCPFELFNQDSPLHYAAANDHADICALLVEEGHVNVNIQNRTGDTPLHVAVANDRLNSTRQLLTLNADLNITNHAEMTPVMVAQLAKCKHAIEATRPFIEQMKQKQPSQISKSSSVDDEYKYMYSMDADNPLPDRRMSCKRDVVFKKGFMQKQGKKFKHFHDRYFILWSNGIMNYYAKEHTLFANYAEVSKPKLQNKDSLQTPCSPSLESQESISRSEMSKRRIKKTKPKRSSTLAKLGLKSDVIKAKGVIDINDLIETQFLEFSDGIGSGWALITPGREWKFKCASDKERREWIAAVHAVNYGISPFDIKNLGMNISYEHNTMLLEPASNAFVNFVEPNAVASGWMFKLGAAPKGLEQNYWKKRWVSLYKKPARLAYAEHPHGKDTKKGVVQLNDVTNIIKVGDNDMIKQQYKAPTVHVFALITEKRTWVFATKTAEECARWHDRISFFIPDQWKKLSNVNVDELLKMNRIKTLRHLDDLGDDDEDSKETHLTIARRKKKKKGDDGMMSKLFRKVSNVAETLGITEQYSTISEVHPRGTMHDYDEALVKIEKQMD